MKKARNGYIKNLHYLCLVGVIALGLMTIVGTGGGGGGGGTTATDTTPATDTTGGSYAISGYIQKGPFISGSSITIQELDDDLNPTGISYETSTIYDFGAFSLGSQIESSYIEVIANGFYFDEVKGELSAANLRLRATTDLLAGENVNINILTTLEQDRIEYLIANEGSTFTEARAQAEIEVLSIFNISGENISTFDQMDISQEGDSNAILLAVSSILQGTNSVAELSELISKISLDIKEDGTLDNSTCVDEIKNNSMNLDLNAVRANLANRYQSLGLAVTIAGFEAYVDSDGDGSLNGNDEDFMTDGPTNVTAAAGDGEITISWDSVSGAISYNIYWSTSSGVSKDTYEGKIEDITETSYTHTGLTNDTTYYYVITAETSYGESDLSSEILATPSATGEAPSAPINVSAAPGDGEITISWDAVSGAARYNVYWATSSGVSMDTYEGKIEDITTTSYTHTDLANGTTYYYVVTAENDYGESDESDEVSAAAGFEISIRTIIVDGMPSDWFGIEPVMSDAQGNSSCGSGTDIKSFYVAKDSNYLYWCVDTWSGTFEFGSSDLPKGPAVVIYSFSEQGEILRGVEAHMIGSSEEGSIATRDYGSDWVWFDAGPQYGQANQVAEGKIPLSLFEGYEFNSISAMYHSGISNVLCDDVHRWGELPIP